MYVKIKLTDEPSWPMCILDLSKQPAKGTAQNTERLNVNGAACRTKRGRRTSVATASAVSDINK